MIGRIGGVSLKIPLTIYVYTHNNKKAPRCLRENMCIHKKHIPINDKT